MENSKYLVFGVVLATFLTTSTAIECYQCSGTDTKNPFQCNEWLSSDIDIRPEACDNVYGARYCVKHVGRFEANSLECYQCSSTRELDCSDLMIHMGGTSPQSCDHIFEAQYCVKSISLDGGIGTKRFCSSLDLGNYCNYVRQPGDTLTYRTCIYTCTGDGCNGANAMKNVKFLSVFMLILISFKSFF